MTKQQVNATVTKPKPKLGIVSCRFLIFSILIDYETYFSIPNYRASKSNQHTITFTLPSLTNLSIQSRLAYIELDRPSHKCGNNDAIDQCRTRLKGNAYKEQIVRA
jgi:hypothetical protein